MRHKILSAIVVMLLMLAIPITAFGFAFDYSEPCSFSVTLRDAQGNTPGQGVELSAYHVATAKIGVEDKLIFTYTNGFEACGVYLNDPNLVPALDRFVEGHSAVPIRAVTDSQGKAEFSNLPAGVYFVKQTNSVSGYAPCTPFIVTLPHLTNEGYVYNINASPKTEMEKLTDITIKKVWNTDESTKVADSVTVQLLRDGAVVQTATLSKQNQWKITYADMPISDAYSVKEINVPKGFTPTYSQKGYEFTVTNSATLIQTGQLVWPIPVLALAGMMLIALGAVILRRTGHADE